MEVAREDPTETHSNTQLGLERVAHLSVTVTSVLDEIPTVIPDSLLRTGAGLVLS